MRPTLRSTLAALRADAARYPEGWRTAPGFWSTASYRVRRLRRRGPRWFHLNILRKLVLLPVDLAVDLRRRWLEACALPANCEIGAGLLLPHPTGIVLHDAARIGARCTIYQHVTIGGNGRLGVPELRDSVEVYASAVVFGAIVVGNGARIGANVVVGESVGERETLRSVAPVRDGER